MINNSPTIFKRVGVTTCLLLTVLSFNAAYAQRQATWIWYPSDYDTWLANKMQNRRSGRGTFFPPFWRMDNHYVLVDFHKVFDLPQAEEVEIFTEGQYNVKLDSKMINGIPKKVTIPAGRHKLNIKIHSQTSVPAIYVRGATIVSDSTWLVTFEDKEWIDASGMVSDQPGTEWLNASFWNFNNPQAPPAEFSLPPKPIQAVKIDRKPQSRVVNFGKETFGFVKLHGLKGKGKVSLYYRESLEEPLAEETTETMDHLEVNQQQSKDMVLEGSRAFCFVEHSIR